MNSLPFGKTNELSIHDSLIMRYMVPQIWSLRNIQVLAQPQHASEHRIPRVKNIEMLALAPHAS